MKESHHYKTIQWKAPDMTFQKIGFLLAFWLLLATVVTPVSAQEKTLKIGVVRMNDVLNESKAGKRTKEILVASKDQKEKELKSKEDQLKKLRSELEANILLSQEARAAKENELRTKLEEMRKELQKAQQELQVKERKMTQDIYKELKVVIKKLAETEKYDFVIDETAAQVIMFSKFGFEDITSKVLTEYNKMTR